MPTPSFKKRRSTRADIGSYFALSYVIFLGFMVVTLMLSYVYGVTMAFKASVVTGVIFLFPPLGVTEGLLLAFLNYDMALALKAVAAANGLML